MANQPPFFIQFAPIFIIILIFYFLILKPQKQKQQDHQSMVDNLIKNDEVVTSGGIHGTVVKIDSDVLTLRVDDNVRIKIDKKSIAHVKKKG